MSPPTLATDHIPMAKTTTTPAAAAAAHNGPVVFQATSTDPQQQKQHRAPPTKTQPQSSFSSSPSPLTLRSDIVIGSATTIDLYMSTALTRPANYNYNAKKKRILTRRTSPPRTRSMTRANSSLIQDPPSTPVSTSSSLLSSRSPSSLAKPVTMMTAPERTRELVSTRATTTESSASSVPTAPSPATAPVSHNVGRVRQAVNQLEEKMLLNHQAQWSSPSPSSRALILGGKRPRSLNRDDASHLSKYPRTQSHQGFPKRHTQPAAVPAEDNLPGTFSFQFPAGLDPSFPLGLVGQFLAPSQTAQAAATSSPAGSRPLGHSGSSRARSSTGGVASSINATGQIIEQDTTADTIKSIAEMLLRHLPTAHHTPPPPPTVESLMSDPSTQYLRRVPLTTRSSSNTTTHLSLPAITLPLPTEGPRPPRNRNTRTPSNPERVRLSWTYHLERQDSSNQHAVLDAIDVEPVSPLDELSSSAPASSTTPRCATTRVHQPHK
ncbi:hypothetical protein BGZ89_009743 [Linnemannia elongata]|nr:hypothetical protein BGZ89_009743 [Linnemannia elongata]